MITDHACLTIEQKGGRIENKYRKYIARDHSAFDVNQFIEIVEDGLEYNRNMNVSKRAMRLIDNIVQGLDIVALKKQFKIPRIWEGKRKGSLKK